MAAEVESSAAQGLVGESAAERWRVGGPEPLVGLQPVVVQELPEEEVGTERKPVGESAEEPGRVVERQSSAEGELPGLQQPAAAQNRAAELKPPVELVRESSPGRSAELKESVTPERPAVAILSVGQRREAKPE